MTGTGWLSGVVIVDNVGSSVMNRQVCLQRMCMIDRPVC